MPDTPANTTSPWSDQFTKPTLEALVGGIAEEQRPAFEAVLGEITGRKGCKARVEWLGLPWRWTIVCSATGLEHPDLAYLIAVPDRPLLCVPVALTGEAAPNPDKLTKPVRQALDRSAIIAGYVWAEWPTEEADLVALNPLLDARARG